MSESSDRKLERRLRPVLELLGRQELIEHLADMQEGDRDSLAGRLAERHYLETLRRRIRRLHPADMAHLIEMLPPDERRLTWRVLPDSAGGRVLADIPDAVARDLIGGTSDERLKAMFRHADADVLAVVDDLLPEDARRRLFRDLEARERRFLEDSFRYPEEAVGRLMAPDVLAVSVDGRIGDTLDYLRGLGDLPDHTDKIFVVDDGGRLKGVLPLKTLIISPPLRPVADALAQEVVSFSPREEAAEAAKAFERYDLVSAPVVDADGRLLGRVTVDVMMDFIREEAEEDAFMREGLRRDEDLFGPVWRSARYRWGWLCLNLFTAFLASRVISVFEDSIEKLVALATLMPIVASIGGNTGNQTIALVVRGLALDQIGRGNVGYLAGKELGVATINGLLWGGAMGGVTWLLYGNASLGAVMGAATFLNLVVAAGTGIAVPLAMERLDHDPALGSSVVLTFVTDSMGFFIFLGLASVFLAP